MDDAVEYHNQPHIQPLMASECTETRGAHDAVMMVTALEDANFVQYKVRGQTIQGSTVVRAPFPGFKGQTIPRPSD